MAKKTTITIETKSLLILQSKSSTQGWCPVCGAEVELIVIEGDRLLIEHAESLAQGATSGGVHWVKSSGGASLICLNSLLERAQNRKP